MTPALPAPPLLVITDRLSAQRDLSDTVAEVLEAGCRWIMVREKDMDTAALVALAENIVDQARPYGAHISVNGDPKAAGIAGASGAHLQSAAQVSPARVLLGQDALIGVSSHNLEEAQKAADAGADYVTMSPIFLTDSKPGYGPAIGLDALGDLCRQLPVPVIALAGITPATAPLCLENGAAAVAVMGSVMRSDAPSKVTGEFLKSIGAGAGNL